MFTGIVTHRGHVAQLARRASGLVLRIAAPELAAAGLVPGESIAVSGACLTVTQHDAEGFAADVSAETLACTTLGDWTVGTPVNLERALALGERLGGHMMSGHVDGVARVTGCAEDGDCLRATLAAPSPLARYVARKGSVALDGVSLTVNEVDGSTFGVNLIPATLAATTLGAVAPGVALNLEVDLLARYLERLASGSADET